MSQATESEKTPIDPVCGMPVTPSPTSIKSDYDGQTFFFCAPACRDAFEAAPLQFINPRKKGLWGRYMDRLQKATGGKAMKCCN